MLRKENQGILNSRVIPSPLNSMNFQRHMSNNLLKFQVNYLFYHSLHQIVKTLSLTGTLGTVFFKHVHVLCPFLKIFTSGFLIQDLIF